MNRNALIVTWGAVLTVLVVLTAAWPCAAQATYTVTTSADSGDGSLRAAIEAANASPGLDTIMFALDPAMGLTIVPATDLPAVTDAVVIDGTTQPGVTLKALYTEATWFGTGLTLACAGSTIQGLTLTRFETGIYIDNVPNNIIHGVVLPENKTNIHITGEEAAGNIVAACTIGRISLTNYGVFLENAGANIIGGPDAADGNVIGGGYGGIWIIGGGDNLIQGNFIGVTRDEYPVTYPDSNGNMLTYPNYKMYGKRSNLVGIYASETSGNIIEDNKICRNTYGGIQLEDCAAANYIYRNNIGGWAGSTVGDTNLLNPSTTEQVLGNYYAGARIGNGVHLFGCSGQVIGGPGLGNVIAHNNRGIMIADSEERQSQDNTIQGNWLLQSYFGNGETVEVALAGASGTLVGGMGEGESNYFFGRDDASLFIVSCDDYPWTTRYPATDNQIVGNQFFNARSDRSTVLLHGDVASNSILMNTFFGYALPYIDLGATLRSVEYDERGWSVVTPLHGDGQTPNDPLDADTGPNGLQNYPVLSEAWFSDNHIVITGSLDSQPNATYSLDFNVNYEAVGWTEVTTDAAGHVDFTASLPAPALSYVFTQPVVWATATDASGNTSEVSPSIKSTNSYIASFTATPDSTDIAHATITVNAIFGDSMTGYSGGSRTHATVDWGDGTVTTATTIYPWDPESYGGTSWWSNETCIATDVHTYTSPGIYTVRLTLTDDPLRGGADTQALTVTVNNPAPTANAGSDQNVTVPHDGNPASNTVPVTLDGSASSDPDGDTLTYLWQEDDITLGTTATLTVDLAAGTHVITLTVTDSWGAPGTAQTTVTVAPEPNQAPIANAGTNQTIQTSGAPVTATLNGSGSSDPDNDALTYAWTENGTQIGTGVSPSVVLALGTHTIVLTVTDSYGATATSTVVVTVSLVYTWSGVLQPIDPPNAAGVSASVFKTGSTVPVKFALTGPSVGITTLAATLSYAKISNGVVGSDIEAVSTAAATTGNLFRYDAATGQYIFNWSTKGLSAGTYRLIISLGDGVERTVNLGLK